jgi:hypothetical protein
MMRALGPSMHFRVAWMPFCREACKPVGSFIAVPTLGSIGGAHAMNADRKRSRSQRGPKNG